MEIQVRRKGDGYLYSTVLGPRLYGDPLQALESVCRLHVESKILTRKRMRQEAGGLHDTTK